PRLLSLSSRRSLRYFFFSCSADPPPLHSFLHDALPISRRHRRSGDRRGRPRARPRSAVGAQRVRACRGRPTLAFRRVARAIAERSEEHTSELQSRENLVCRLLLEKKKKKDRKNNTK